MSVESLCKDLEDLLPQIKGVSSRNLKEVKPKLTHAKLVLRSLRLEIQSIPETKQTKWKPIYSTYDSQLRQVEAIVADLEAPKRQKSTQPTQETTQQIMKRALDLQQDDIAMLQNMVSTMDKATGLGSKTLGGL